MSDSQRAWVAVLLILLILAVLVLTDRLMWVTVHCVLFESGSCT